MPSIDELKSQQEALLRRQQVIAETGRDPATGQSLRGFGGAGRVLGNVQASIAKEYERLNREIQQQTLLNRQAQLVAQGASQEELYRAGVTEQQQSKFFEQRRPQTLGEVQTREAVQPRTGSQDATIREQVAQAQARAQAVRESRLQGGVQLQQQRPQSFASVILRSKSAQPTPPQPSRLKGSVEPPRYLIAGAEGSRAFAKKTEQAFEQEREKSAKQRLDDIFAQIRGQTSKPKPPPAPSVVQKKDALGQFFSGGVEIGKGVVEFGIDLFAPIGKGALLTEAQIVEGTKAGPKQLYEFGAQLSRRGKPAPVSPFPDRRKERFEEIKKTGFLTNPNVQAFGIALTLGAVAPQLSAFNKALLAGSGLLVAGGEARQLYQEPSLRRTGRTAGAVALGVFGLREFTQQKPVGVSQAKVRTNVVASEELPVSRIGGKQVADVEILTQSAFGKLFRRPAKTQQLVVTTDFTGVGTSELSKILGDIKIKTPSGKLKGTGQQALELRRTADDNIFSVQTDVVRGKSFIRRPQETRAQQFSVLLERKAGAKPTLLEQDFQRSLGFTLKPEVKRVPRKQPFFTEEQFKTATTLSERARLDQAKAAKTGQLLFEVETVKGAKPIIEIGKDFQPRMVGFEGGKLKQFFTIETRAKAKLARKEFKFYQPKVRQARIQTITPATRQMASSSGGLLLQNQAQVIERQIASALRTPSSAALTNLLQPKGGKLYRASLRFAPSQIPRFFSTEQEFLRGAQPIQKDLQKLSRSQFNVFGVGTGTRQPSIFQTRSGFENLFKTETRQVQRQQPKQIPRQIGRQIPRQVERQIPQLIPELVQIQIPQQLFEQVPRQVPRTVPRGVPRPFGELVPPPDIPFGRFKFKFGELTTSKEKKKRPKKRYSPSLVAISLGISGKTPKGFVSGLGVRPLSLKYKRIGLAERLFTRQRKGGGKMKTVRLLSVGLMPATPMKQLLKGKKRKPSYFS